MRKVLMLVLSFAVITSTAYAHPPSDIQITFNPQTQEVKAIIFHQVSDMNKHYIKKVDIGINDKEIVELKFSKQDNLVTQSVIYKIPEAKAGDRLSVEAYCSLSGKLEKEIKVK